MFHSGGSKKFGHALIYTSIISFGNIIILEDTEEKAHGIKVLASHYCEKGIHVKRAKQALDNVAMLETDIL